MAQQDGAVGKSPAASVLQSRFMVGSVSEENSEDENQAKADLHLEEKENRSLSPSSCSSDSAYETGFDHVDGAAHNLRLAIKPFFGGVVNVAIIKSNYTDAIYSYSLRWAFYSIFSLLCDSSIF